MSHAASGATGSRPHTAPTDTFASLSRAIIRCERCPRLRAHCAEVARVRKREFAGEEYWGRPVPSLGDPHARLLIVGLAWRGRITAPLQRVHDRLGAERVQQRSSPPRPDCCWPAGRASPGTST